MSSEKGEGSSFRFGKEYDEFFQPYVFLSTFYNTVDGYKHGGAMHTTFAENWHLIFHSGDINGRRLLDIGTGPSIMSSIPASRNFKELYWSDIAECNLQVLRNWLDRNPCRHDWEPFFKFFAEKHNQSEDWQHLEENLRSVSKMFCDVTSLKTIHWPLITWILLIVSHPALL